MFIAGGARYHYWRLAAISDKTERWYDAAAAGNTHKYTHTHKHIGAANYLLITIVEITRSPLTKLCLGFNLVDRGLIFLPDDEVEASDY